MKVFISFLICLFAFGSSFAQKKFKASNKYKIGNNINWGDAQSLEAIGLITEDNKADLIKEARHQFNDGAMDALTISVPFVKERDARDEFEDIVYHHGGELSKFKKGEATCTGCKVPGLKKSIDMVVQIVKNRNGTVTMALAPTGDDEDAIRDLAESEEITNWLLAGAVTAQYTGLQEVEEEIKETEEEVIEDAEETEEEIVDMEEEIKKLMEELEQMQLAEEQLKKVLEETEELKEFIEDQLPR